MKKPTFEVTITQPIEVHVDGCNFYRTAKTMEEAKRFAEEMRTEAIAKWKKEHSQEIKNQKRLEFINHNVNNYIDYLKKQLWHDQRFKYGDVLKDAAVKERVEVKKQIMNDLKDIFSQKKRCSWNQSYLNESDYYTMEEIKKEEYE